jgi:hypothetical protein
VRAREVTGDALPAARVESDPVDQEQRRAVPELAMDEAVSSHRRRGYPRSQAGVRCVVPHGREIRPA